MDSSERPAIYSAAPTSTGFYSQKFMKLYSWCRKPGLLGLAWGWDLQLPRCPTTTHCMGCCCCRHHTTFSPHWLSGFAPPTRLGKYFFFKSSVVGFPYSLVFWQLWLFFVVKLVVILFMGVRGGDVCVPMPPSWPEVSLLVLFGFLSLCSFYIFCRSLLATRPVYIILYHLQQSILS